MSQIKLLPIAFLVLLAVDAHPAFACTFVCVRQDGNVAGSGDQENRDRCTQYCEFEERVRDAELTPTGSCMGPTPPPLPIQVDACSCQRPTVETYKGTPTALTARRAGTSFLRVPKTVKCVRVWCHVWVENDPTQQGLCNGFGSSSCGRRVGWLERQNLRVREDSNSNEWIVEIDVNNQHSSETRHFSTFGTSYDGEAECISPP